MVMEALELHRRFPYAVCGHLFFLGSTESALPSKKFGTVLGEAAVLMSGISNRRLPTDAPELYEELGILLFDPGDADSLDLAPASVPPELHAITYPRRLIQSFNRRNPSYLQPLKRLGMVFESGGSISKMKPGQRRCR